MINLSCPDMWHPAAPCWWCLIGAVLSLFTSANKDGFDSSQTRKQHCLAKANKHLSGFPRLTWVTLEFLVVRRTEMLSGFRLYYPFISWWKWSGPRFSGDFTSCFITNNSFSCQSDDGFHRWKPYLAFLLNGREQRNRFFNIGSLDF